MTAAYAVGRMLALHRRLHLPPVAGASAPFPLTPLQNVTREPVAADRPPLRLLSATSGVRRLCLRYVLVDELGDLSF